MALRKGWFDLFYPILAQRRGWQLQILYTGIGCKRVSGFIEMLRLAARNGFKLHELLCLLSVKSLYKFKYKR